MDTEFSLNEFLEKKRELLQAIVNEIDASLKMAKDVKFEDGVDIGEVFANLTLAKRHAEDARMRLGKVFQALDGGKSIYNK